MLVIEGDLSLGRRTDIEKAIELIAKRFPPERYPQVAFKPINKKIILRQRAPECVAIAPAVAQVNRRKEIDTIVHSLLSSTFRMEFRRMFWLQVLFLVIISSFNRYIIHPILNLLDLIIQCLYSIIIQK